MARQKVLWKESSMVSLSIDTTERMCFIYHICGSEMIAFLTAATKYLKPQNNEKVTTPLCTPPRTQRFRPITGIAAPEQFIHLCSPQSHV